MYRHVRVHTPVLPPPTPPPWLQAGGLGAACSVFKSWVRHKYFGEAATATATHKA